MSDKVKVIKIVTISTIIFIFLLAVSLIINLIKIGGLNKQARELETQKNAMLAQIEKNDEKGGGIMLRILLGRARTGKSARVLEEIRALGDSSQQILLVPEHASHVAEVDVCRACGVTASRHAEVLTFKLLASRVLTLTGGAADSNDVDIVIG